MNDFWQNFRLALSPNSAFIEAWQHLRKDTHMDRRCISQNELAQRWQISEATLERWRSQRKGPQYLRLGGQVRYRLADVEAYELEKMEVVTDTQQPPKGLISPALAKRIISKQSTA
jgi:predicted DNA-binding transcriptional regulator AlpA